MSSESSENSQGMRSAPVLVPRGIVFVVDDEDGIRAAVSSVLEQKGYLVLNARDGIEALARLHGFRERGVLLVDLAMPRMDGEAFLDRLGRLGMLDRIGVVVVTGRKDVPATPFPVLKKPFTTLDLLAIVEAQFRVLRATR